MKCNLRLGKLSIEKIDELLSHLNNFKKQEEKSLILLKILKNTPFEFEPNLPPIDNDCIRINLETFDCTTFIYNYLAFLFSKNYNHFIYNLYNIRYDSSISNRVDNCLINGNLFDFVEESLLINAIKKGYLIDITEKLCNSHVLEKFSCFLKQNKRSSLIDIKQHKIVPKYGERSFEAYFIPSKYFTNINWSDIKNGDIIIKSKNNSENTIINHISIAIKTSDSSQVYFYHATRHFYINKIFKDTCFAFNDKTSLFAKYPQIGTDIAALFAGENTQTEINGIQYFGFIPNTMRPLEEYLLHNFMGFKILRPAIREK